MIVKVMNKEVLFLEEEQQEVGGWITCIVGCGSICLYTGGLGTEIAAVASVV